MKELVDMIRKFSDIMDKHTKWKNPTPEHALLFAIGEIGEAIQAWVYQDANGGYSPNNENETVGEELIDCFVMCVKAGLEITAENEDAFDGSGAYDILFYLRICNNSLWKSYCNNDDVVWAASVISYTGLITKHSVTSRLISIAKKQIGKLHISETKQLAIWKMIADVLGVDPFEWMRPGNYPKVEECEYYRQPGDCGYYVHYNGLMSESVYDSIDDAESAVEMKKVDFV